MDTDTDTDTKIPDPPTNDGSPASNRGNAARTTSFWGGMWYTGWLFTIAYAELTFWNAAAALIAWPYYLGVALRPH